MKWLFIFFVLALTFTSSPVSAQLLDQSWRERLWLTEASQIRSQRHPFLHSYSRFPKSEKSLAVYSLKKSLHDAVYTPANAYRYTVVKNDTFKKIARRHQTTLEVIRALNGGVSDFIKIGQKVWVPNQAFTLEVDKMMNRLYLKSGGIVIKDYPVSTGKSEQQTPLGVFVIQSRYPFPTWFHKGVVISPGAPDNFLGTRWLGFDKPQYGIHGTIFPELIGQSVSKGCIRMKNEDVEELYEFIPVGTIVTIKDSVTP